jgi:hypothetical protein
VVQFNPDWLSSARLQSPHHFDTVDGIEVLIFFSRAGRQHLDRSMIEKLEAMLMKRHAFIDLVLCGSETDASV